MKFSFIILAVLIGSLTFAAADMPKIAVYVISSELSNSEKKAFEKEFVNRFSQGKKYIVVDRSDASLNALSNEMATQREGSVDINQISEMGRQAGVRFLCLVDFTQAFGVHTIEARLLETETAHVPASGIHKIKNIKDIEDIGIGKIVEDIFMQIEGKSKAKNRPAQGSKFGARAGFNMLNFSFGEKEFDDRIDKGTSFGGGLAVSIPLTSQLSFNPELAFYYRNVFSLEFSYDIGEKDEISMSELTVSIPVLLQFVPIDGGSFYLAAGVQVEIPISTEIKMKSTYDGQTEEETDDVLANHRTIDFGIALGLGYMITPKLGIDFRYVIGMTGLFENYTERIYDEHYGPYEESFEDKSSLTQFGIGITYFF
jgi:hypothetical protein